MIQSSSEMNERYNILPLPSRAVVCLKIISYELSYDPKHYLHVVAYSQKIAPHTRCYLIMI